MKLKKVDKDSTVKNLFGNNKGKTHNTKYKSLKEVMDLNRPFSMMFSGVEDERNFNILYNMGVRNFLISFHYVQRKHLSTKKYKEMGIKFFVDSGAFTYMNDVNCEKFTIEQWESHIESYLKWVRKNSDIIFAIANLDLELLVGGEQVQKWNEKYFEPFMLETGIPVCFIYHEEAPKLSWEQYCQRYPYVGVSLVTSNVDTFKWCLDKLRISEKYRSLVHGMGMTQTSLLTKLPFYTVDSTTWLVGLQYGEINYWTGTKMTRLKKDKWKGSMLERLVSKGFDKQKLLDEDKEEMVKVNVQAFIEAEVFIQSRLKSLMYWLKPESINRSEEDLDSINYPSAEWLETAYDKGEGWETYAKSFNVTTEDKETSINCIMDITILMNWDKEEYQSRKELVYTPEFIKELHDTWINRIVTSDEERINDLKEFFKEVLLGKTDKLLVLGTNFDRIVKERDDYVTDEEYEIADVSDMDLQNTMMKYLPAPVEGSPAPEISDLDDEIFKEEGIVPVRDSQGRFLKGQKQVLKPKKMYSNKYPKMACDMCINAQKCPEYKAGYVCAYNKMFERYNTRDMGDIIQAMQGIVDFSLIRLQRGMLTETMNGGLPDPSVTGMMNQTMGLLTQLQRMYEVGNQEVIRQTKIVRSDGTQEMTTQVSNPQRGGILSQIFGSMGSDNTEETEETPETTETVIE